jgi:hypothetical protein
MVKGKAIQLEAWTGPESSNRLPDFIVFHINLLEIENFFPQA